MRRTIIIVCLLLAGITLGIYWPARHFNFVYYDDPLFILNSDEINSGLNWHSFGWVFSGVLVANWHPVTSLSFVIGHQLWGLNPGDEHLVNLVFHAANAVILFLVLIRLTTAVWRSAAVAAIFAWHPLRVESVAWIAERKDVLCVFFFLLSIWAYVAFKQSRRPGRKAKVYFGACLLTFLLALMSKPMAVTLPFVLLLLDLWPLQKATTYDSTIWKKLVIEKWPFFALSLLSSYVTFAVQKHSSAVVEWHHLGLADRVSTAISSYLQYLEKLFWPVQLAVFYPYPQTYDVWMVMAKAMLLLALTALFIMQFKRRPYLAFGWLWYLGTAVPIIGLVQVGEQAMADRYTYIPLIGPVISLVWLTAETFKARKIFPVLIATVVLTGCLAFTNRQLQFWQDTDALAGHDIEVVGANSNAYFLLGVNLYQDGQVSQAATCYRVATAIIPYDVRPFKNLANLLYLQGFCAAAEVEAKAELELYPDDAATHFFLAEVVGRLGRPDEALNNLNEAVRLDPDLIGAANNLAWMLATSPDESVRNGSRAVQLAEHVCTLTDYKKVLCVGTLAAAYAEAGRFDDAVRTAQKACDLAAQSNAPGLLKDNQTLLTLYLQHKPYHEAQ